MEAVVSLILVNDNDICAFIRQELEQRFLRSAPFTSATQTQDYLIARLAQEEREVFATLFLDTRHRLLRFEPLFAGTIDSCAVHVREVAKRALALNAAAVILGHNHPSGDPEPSVADQNITQRLREALELFDIRVLDHIIVGGGKAVSFADRGLM